MRICANFLYVIAHGFSPMNTDKELKIIFQLPINSTLIRLLAFADCANPRRKNIFTTLGRCRRIFKNDNQCEGPIQTIAKFSKVSFTNYLQVFSALVCAPFSFFVFLVSFVVKFLY